MICNYAFVSYCPDNMAAGRWDQEWISRILRGEDFRPAGAVTFTETDRDAVLVGGGVLVVAVGHYREHGERYWALRKLWDDMLTMPWGIVIATSDEGSTFEWNKIDPWPDHIRLWVQLPRVDHAYPPSTRFFGEGSPTSPVDIRSDNAAFTRDLDVALSAQVNHVRRSECFDVLEAMPVRKAMIRRTDGFTKGVSTDEYLHELTRAWVVPAPAGILSQSSFRCFEALEAGAIPIADGLRPDGTGAGFWEMLEMGEWLPVIDDWSMAPKMINEILDDRATWSARVLSGWQQYKRDLVRRLHDDVIAMTGAEPRGERGAPEDLITVIVTTSPVPSNPDISMTVQVIRSVQERLPNAEILVACDGVRDEQIARRDEYAVYTKWLCDWALGEPNVTPVVFGQHFHQSGMMRAVLPMVDTAFVLFVEHDCPLVGDPIPWRDVIATMNIEGLTSMRFMHEATILDSHKHLFLDRRDGAVPWAPTIQWSQRPHLARTGWYENIIESYFGIDSLTMIEDVMHGIVQYGSYAGRIQAVETWERWRMGVYAPDGDMKRSGHLDGRAGDPKFPMLITYNDARPDGAPPEGWTR